MNLKKKKILFYPIGSSGHINLSAHLAKTILDLYSDQIEDIYFIVDNVYKEKLLKFDSRFKFGLIEYDNKDSESGLIDLVDKLEKILYMPLIEKLKTQWSMFTEDKTMKEIDIKAQKLIAQIKPDFVLADQAWHPASLSIESLKGNYSFLVSANPLMLAFENFPRLGDDSKLDEKEKIQKFRVEFEEQRIKSANYLKEQFKERGLIFNKDLPVDLPISNHFTIYSYTLELDYYNDQIREKHNLWQLDAPINLNTIPKPLKLPEYFKNLPGKIIYISLGSGFSIYYKLLQKLINSLEKLDHKYIVSKGVNGDKLKFPSNKFIGDNYVDQLAVLQVVDLALNHGGNNSMCESFLFSVPQIIVPIIGDQINNGTRICELNYGYKLDIMNYTDEELSLIIDKALNNLELKSKLNKISERIRKENRMEKVCHRLIQYLNNKI